MDDRVLLTSRAEMKRLYGSFYYASPRVRVDRRNVPRNLWPLVRYARFWGILDDCVREDLVRQAPAEVRRNLKAVLLASQAELMEWLAGPDADSAACCEEYFAFSALGMAADFIPLRELEGDR
jgi:hypothetical protein